MGFLTNEGLERLWNHICSGFNNLQSQINNLNIPSDYVPSTRKINNKELSSDIALSASDVGAVPSSGQTASRVMISNESGNVEPSVITTTELGYLDGVTSNIQTQLDDKANVEHTVSLVLNGTAIAENSDLNTIEFLAVGNYNCGTYTKARTLLNCPTGTAFRMEVFNPTGSTYGDETTSTWRYRVRKITTISGDVWMQAVDSGSTAGVFTYGEWMLTLTTKSKLIVDSQNYGSALPATGVEGQIFFKQVT